MAHDDVMEVLDCDLSPDEVNNKAQLMAAAYKDYETIEAQKKEANAAFKDALDGARDQMKKLGLEIASRSEKRSIQCRWIEDREHAVKRLVRQDTGAIVREKIMTKDELQEELDLDHPDEHEPLLS